MITIVSAPRRSLLDIPASGSPLPDVAIALLSFAIHSLIPFAGKPRRHLRVCEHRVLLSGLPQSVLGPINEFTWWRLVRQ